MKNHATVSSAVPLTLAEKLRRQQFATIETPTLRRGHLKPALNRALHVFGSLDSSIARLARANVDAWTKNRSSRSRSVGPPETYKRRSERLDKILLIGASTIVVVGFVIAAFFLWLSTLEL